MSVKNACSRSHFKSSISGIAICVVLAGFAFAQVPENKPAGGEATTPPADAAAKIQPGQSMFPAGLPKLEQFLTSALERHPDVVVARSKVEGARAELTKAEAVAMKELMQLYQKAQSKRASFEALRQQAGQVPGAVVGAKLLTEASDLSLLEWEAALAMGFQVASRPPTTVTTSLPKQTGTDQSAASQVFVDIAYPKNAVAAKIKEALTQELEIDLQEASLLDVRNFITEHTGIQVVLDDTSLTEYGFQVDAANLKLKGKGIAVASLIQEIEDRYRPLYFVVRDYGILVTLHDEIAGGQYTPVDAISIRDFANLTEQEIRDKYRAKLEAAASRFNRQLGGMGGGGMGGGGGGGFF
jgi:hypothetical protein